MYQRGQKYLSLFILLLLVFGLSAWAQQSGIQLHGSVQSEFLVPEDDALIGTESSEHALLNNTYVDLGLTSRYVDAGARVEFMQYPLPGFEPAFQGWGVPHVYAKGKLKGMELTLGDYYEQFGSGLILRTYEERSLGIDNALRGARFKVNSLNGFRFTALAGVQRTYWKWDDESRVYGADAEADLSELFGSMGQKGIVWTLGTSWVMKSEEKVTDGYGYVFVPGTLDYLNLPQHTSAFDVRSQFHLKDVTLFAEYAAKGQDPSASNSYTYHHGSAALFSASYSKKGFSTLVQAKRSEDMAFRSHRGMTGTAGYLNHMPAFAYQHTYALAALYPYATQYCNINPTGTQLVPGEWALQAEAAYSIKRGTPLGGKYGTKMKANFSHIRGLDATPVESHLGYVYGTDGYVSSFFGTSDEAYYQDFNIQLEKKFTKHFKLNLMYMNQLYNHTIVEGHGGMQRSHIFVGEGKYQFNDKTTLRGEAQYLATGHESGDWMYGLLELSVLPHLMFTVSDMVGSPYINGSYGPKQHYYLGSITYNHGAHRATLGYGRTHAGYNCSGGVCRWIPASRGVQATYNVTF